MNPADPAEPAALEVATDLPPTGFTPHTRHSPLTDPWQPLYARPVSLDEHEVVQLALPVRLAHCNGRGFVHGGLIAALADNAMGLSAVVSARRQRPDTGGAVTVSLTLDYLDSARPGEWLLFEPQVLKCGGSLAFAECHVRTGNGRRVARASASFRLS